MSPATTVTTDHSKAKADGAHSHGVVPHASRGERLTSFDLADFPIPSGREEDWRFTPLSKLEGALEDLPVDHTPVWNLEALPPGASVLEIPKEEARRRSVRAPSDRAGANAATHAPRTLVLSIAPGAVIKRAIEIGILFEDHPLRTHFLMEVGEGADVTVVARYTGTANISEFLSFDLAPTSRLKLVLIDESSSDTVFLTDLVARLGRDAKLQCSVVMLGSGVARRNTTVVMAGEGAEVDLYGLYFADSGQHLENRVFVDHVAPRCRSRVAFKGALAGDTARTVWIGDVLIRAEAEGTDTYELNRNLILTDGARADSVPNLEIETGEIAGAGHASATGRFDDEQTFYLCSRGIPEEEARRMVVRGFFADLVSQIGVPHVEKSLMRAIDRELGTVHD